MQAISAGHDDGVWRSLDGWREFMALRYPGAQVFSTDVGQGFRTRYHSWQCGGLEFAEIHSASRQTLNVPQPERAAPDCYYLPLQLNGSFHSGQYGRECHGGVRSMLLLDSQMPHWRELGVDSHLLNVRLPKPMLERYLADPHAVCMNAVSADSGQGALVWGFINDLWSRRAELNEADMPALADVLARMVAGIFGTLHDEEAAAASGLVDRQRRRVLECIAENLDDPGLDVQSVAIACGISPRYVHMLMRPTGRTFSQYLLEHRLERCRGALQDRPEKSSITEIAFEWGFNDVSHFSRSFRKRYGLSPREFRRQA